MTSNRIWDTLIYVHFGDIRGQRLVKEESTGYQTLVKQGARMYKGNGRQYMLLEFVTGAWIAYAKPYNKGTMEWLQDPEPNDLLAMHLITQHAYASWLRDWIEAS